MYLLLKHKALLQKGYILMKTPGNLTVFTQPLKKLQQKDDMLYGYFFSLPTLSSSVSQSLGLSVSNLFGGSGCLQHLVIISLCNFTHECKDRRIWIEKFRVRSIYTGNTDRCSSYSEFVNYRLMVKNKQFN